MIELALFHGLGVICVISIVIASRLVIKNARAEKTSSIIIAAILGVLSFIATYGMLLFAYIKINYTIVDRLFHSTSITGRLYLIFIITSCITLFVSSTVGLFFKKHCKPVILASIAFMLNLLMSLQPSGYIWVTWLLQKH